MKRKKYLNHKEYWLIKSMGANYERMFLHSIGPPFPHKYMYSLKKTKTE